MHGKHLTAVGLAGLLTLGAAKSLVPTGLPAAADSEVDRVGPNSGLHVAASAESEGRLIEQPGFVRRFGRITTEIEPIPARSADRDSASDAVAGGGACPEIVQTYSGVDFAGGEFVLQAGMVEEEIAAAQYFADPSEFPIILNVAEIIWAQQQATVTTTTHWSILVWEGNPATGSLIAEFSSDNVILPHIVIPPGTNGVNVQVVVDPDDPEQIVIQNNGSNSFTVGFRIDQHNNPPASGCLCVPGLPQFGTLPAICCPPPTASNAFPTTDPTGLTQPARNWLYARDCPGATGFCQASPGWYQFNQSGMPTGDWNIRVTYTPFTCVEEFGACCLPDGSCQAMELSACESANGQFQGDGTACGGITCPDPVGACCVGEPGGIITCNPLSETECEAMNGAWGGVGTDCVPGACDPPVGACCVPSTGACLDFTEAVCLGVAGIWHGPDTSCDKFTCFPEGACCLPDGSCLESVSPEECDAAGGTFQGDGSACKDVSCPLPTGACCLSNGNCFVFDEATCVAVDGSWAGAQSNCHDSDGNGNPDACDAGSACPADLNGDESVNVFDMLILLGDWGECDDPEDCPADLNADGVVNVFDMLQLLGAWGACP